MIELTTTKYELYPWSEKNQIYAIVIKNKFLANKVNKLLKYYENGDYTAEVGEELLFKFSAGMLDNVLAIVAPRRVA